MRPLYALLFLAGLLLAGCAREGGSVAPAMPFASTGASGSDATQSSPQLPRRSTASLAGLPDRGDLLIYPAKPISRSEVGETRHPVAISEAHAMRALVTGQMVVTAPDGHPIRLRYDRHIEHRNGNWTWVGRDERGAQSIITFGEKAVFGIIPVDARRQLRLTTLAGRSWLVEIDPRKVTAPASEDPDFLVPPELAAAATSDASSQAGSQTRTAAATEAAGPTVDLALGYTVGFAAKYGGDSQAVTRLQHLVDVTNQAYVSSQIGAQLRLVRTVSVNYPDATDNGDTLEKLTGYVSGSGPVTPDPAFAELRAARDQYGADLVSLVRPFRTPENDGCGIAWLIGGDQTTINSSDAPFAYSVVSDGSDRNETDGRTYFCREETLAHETGHNMGQAHNQEDTDSSGAHAYSYGYREVIATGFYTIMAYRSGGEQYPIRYFANPSVVEPQSGRPTGIANASDNARSMLATMPLIANFRAHAMTPQSENTVCNWTRTDFNGDGRSDLFWRHSADGWNAIWHSANSSTNQDVAPESSQLWQIAGYGDFNGDGRSDVLWRHAAQGWNVIWRSANPATSVTIAQVASQDWKAAAVGDFDGDGRSDILWRHAVGGWNVYWPAGDSAAARELAPESDQMWRIVGVGDFNGDGSSDILWRHVLQGWNVIWRSGSSLARTEVTAVPSQDWQVAGIGDFDADGRADILWRATQGWNVYWPSGNSTNARELSPVSDPSWKIVGIADFDGDGRSDLFWRHLSAGWNTVWRSADAATPLAVSAVQDLKWQAPGMCRIDAFTRQ